MERILFGRLGLEKGSRLADHSRHLVLPPQVEMAPLQAMIVKLALVILFMGSGCRGFFLRMSALGGPGKVLGPGAKGGWDDFKV
jgi:hypothetical protein